MKQKPTQKPVARPPAKKDAKKTVEKSPKAVTFLDKNPLWITMGLVSLLIVIIFHGFISGNLYYLFKDIGSDSINSFFPHFQYINHYFQTDGIPLWSFAQGMGQNIQSISISDPFYLLFYLVSPGNVAYAIIWMEIAKILLTAFVIYHFFKLLNLKSIAVIIGTLLYCFSGFMIVGGGWYMFSTETFCLAFLLFSYEMLFQKKSWLFFTPAIALMAIVQPFNLFLYGLFFILFFLVRYFTSDEVTLRRFVRLTMQMAALALLGLLISSFFFWSNLQTLLDSPRVGGNTGFFSKLLGMPIFGMGDSRHNTTAILRLFSNDILGHGTSYKGWYNYLEAPLFYIGLLPLLLMPQIFVMAPRRKTIFYGLFLAILIIPVIFPFFRFAFWLFTGDYYRGFSFFVALSFLFLTLFAFNEIIGTKKINLYVLAGTFIFLMVLLYYPYPNAQNIIDPEIRSLARNFLMVYFILTGLYFFIHDKTYLNFAILFVVIVELGYCNFSNLKERNVLTSQEASQKKGYNDYSVDAVKFINSTDKQFFRIIKTFTSDPAVHTSFNDAKVQGFYGTMVYGSFNQKYYIRFMEEMGLIKKGYEKESRWVQGLVNRPLLQNISSVKYSLVRNQVGNFKGFRYDSIAQFGDVKVLKNNFFLPLGFTYNMYVSLDSLSKVSEVKRDIILQKAFVAENPSDPRFAVFGRYPMRDTLLNYTFQDYFNDAMHRKKDTLAITQFTQNRIRGKIQLDSARMLFLSIPFDKGWHASIDGKEVQPVICNIGFTGLFIEPGKHDVELFFRPPFFHLSIWLTAAGLLLYFGLFGANKYLTKNKQAHVSD